MRAASDYSLNDNPSSFKTDLSFGNEAGPIPWNFKISFSLKVDSTCNEVIPLFSNARLAGAESSERNPFSGLRSFSQVGQVGQSLLL